MGWRARPGGQRRSEDGDQGRKHAGMRRRDRAGDPRRGVRAAVAALGPRGTTLAAATAAPASRPNRRPRRNARPTTGRTLPPAYVDEVGAVGDTCGVMRSFVLGADLNPGARRPPPAPGPGGFLLLPNTLRPKRAPWHRSP